MQSVAQHLLTLSEAANSLPTRPNSCTVWRWCRKGVRARNGNRIRLEHMRLGGRILISSEAIEQFGRALAAADGEHFQMTACDVTPAVVSQRSEAEREAGAHAAIERLRARGIDC